MPSHHEGIHRGDPVTGGAAGAVNAFHAAYWVIFAVAALGAITAAIAFQRRATQAPEPASVPAHGPAAKEPAPEPG